MKKLFFIALMFSGCSTYYYGDFPETTQVNIVDVIHDTLIYVNSSLDTSYIVVPDIGLFKVDDIVRIED